MFNDRGLGGSLWVNTIVIDLCSMIEVLGGSLWVNTIVIDLCSMIEVLGGSLWVNTIIIDLCSIIEVRIITPHHLHIIYLISSVTTGKETIMTIDRTIMARILIF